MFRDLRTERLLIRRVGPTDVEALLARRNEPAVARLQAWELPYPRRLAEDLVARVAAMDGPEEETWWMTTVVEAATREVVGDLVVHMTNQMRTAEVGYSLASAHWGRGYATEALDALVGWLLEELPVTRLAGMLHPDNRASAMVLERTGFLFEGHTRLSFWLGDDNSDDWIYGMTRDDRAQWVRRPRERPDQVLLEPVSEANKAALLALRTHHSQRSFVDPMPESLADALVPDLWEGQAMQPWLRAVRADGQLVGFVMLALPTPTLPEPYLWRLLVDRLHQRRGIGARVIGLLGQECRRRGAAGLLTSWTEGKGSPGPFYERLGFARTGRLVHGETEGRLPLG